MNPIAKNILAILAGIVAGSIVNGGLLMLGMSVVPPPPGVDISAMNSAELKAAMPLFEPRHFIFPFLAHAIGTLIGAFVAAKIASGHKMKIAMGIGFLFLIAGIVNVMRLPEPVWFSVVDLVCAYLPMAFVGGKMAVNRVVGGA